MCQWFKNNRLLTWVIGFIIVIIGFGFVQLRSFWFPISIFATMLLFVLIGEITTNDEEKESLDKKRLVEILSSRES